MENLHERSITCELHTASHNCTRLFIFPRAGNAGLSGVPVVTFTCVVLLISTRGQGCSCAPGIPCALVIEGQCFRQDPGTISAAGTRSRILRAVCHSNRIIKTTACIVMPAPRFIRLVMPALVAGIHVLLPRNALSPWMAGTRPGHDDEGQARLYLALSRRGVIVLFDFNMTVETTVVHPLRHARARRGHPRS